MSQPTKIGDVFSATRNEFWECESVEMDRGGTVYRIVSRPARCDCGREFRQLKLSERNLRIMRHPAHQEGREAAIDREIPDGYVPLFCPRCEHLELGNVSRRDAIREEQRAHDARYEAEERKAMELGV